VEFISISPVTSAALREVGLPVAAEATEYTAAGVVEALVRHVSAGRAARHTPSTPGPRSPGS
jgi:uroporphyrinogen-III synthase